ncbi:alpha/beta fold hydrolase [Chryseolinea soli]|uniref:Alpha/beta hydrolase n=1 Tax=Chryseolinea soli TaxID=2321403 RepID=A0A385SNC8_9BACT|nr:alpha/beta hydrolase [Chryseolinea soli]AYB31861.1 alpha/beta hydrolase [Chryseolinea soli]
MQTLGKNKSTSTPKKQERNVRKTKTTKPDHQLQGPAGTLHIDDGGKGEIAIVFVHSFGGSTEHWRKQLDHVRANYRAIALDFRGHGQSERPRELKYTPEDLAQDIAAVVDDLQLDHFILVAHSMGGHAAVAYASQHPERVSALLLSGTPGKTPAEISKQVTAALESPAYQKVMDDYMHQLLTESRPEIAEVLIKDFQAIPKDETISIIKGLFEFDPLPKIDKYKGPLLLVVSGAESKQPGTLQSQLPNADFKVIDHAGHWTQLDQPEAFNQILDSFLAGH